MDEEQRQPLLKKNRSSLYCDEIAKTAIVTPPNPVDVLD